MLASWTENRDLADRSRLGGSQRPLDGYALREVAFLLVLGLVAAGLTSITVSPIRLPGHAILRGTLSMILGLSLVPRRGAGTIMSVGALLGFALSLPLGGARLPVAAACGLGFLGPALDVVTANVRATGWQLYLRFAAAGLVANLASFAVRMAAGGSGSGRGPGAGTGMGWPVALVSFAIFGLVAGMVCGAIWFRTKPRTATDSP